MIFKTLVTLWQVRIESYRESNKWLICKYVHYVLVTKLICHIFRWKGTGEFINTYFLCRLCALVHDDTHVQHYEDINSWWRGEGTCITGSWRTHAAIAGKPAKGGKNSGKSKPAVEGVEETNKIKDSNKAIDITKNNKEKLHRKSYAPDTLDS